MALIKCSECGKDVSDKAPTCPNCGNPINMVNSSVVQVANAPGHNFHVEPELTSKTWKQVKIVSWLGTILGLFFAFSDNTALRGFGFIFLFFGIISLIVA